MNPRPFDRIALHTVRTLPDCLTERKDLLEALLSLAPPGHPQEEAIRGLLAHLNQHEIAQREFRFDIENNKSAAEIRAD